MALITLDCDLMRAHEHQMGLITSECVPFRFQFRRKAAAYRKEQLENLKATPDWLAQSVGWKDAHEMGDHAACSRNPYG